MSIQNIIKWLPDRILFSDFDGNWEKFLSGIWAEYVKDYVLSKPKLNGKSVFTQPQPATDHKEFTFWHLISEGKIEDDRLPDLDRCERIKWARSIIDNSDCDKIKIWENKRKNGKRILLWLESYDYLVIINSWRKGKLVLLTAYLTNRNHTRKKLQKEYLEYISN